MKKPPLIKCSGKVFDPSELAGDSYWSPEAAQKPIDFFSQCLKHTKGSAAGKPFILEPWQRDITATLFGWLNPDGTRRYRHSYITVPRKNGKTTWVAGLANYITFCDGESRAENYFCGVDREQASLAYRTASAQIRANRELSSVCQVLDSMKRITYRGSFLRALPANEQASHGFDCHLVVADELHVWRGSMFDTLRTGSGARSQPLMLSITTAGYDRHSICFKEYSYAKGVWSGRTRDKTFLPVLYESEETDDWRSPETWEKANPNLGVSLRTDYLETEAERARAEPSYQNTFRRLHCNQWTSQETRWLKMSDWRAAPMSSDPIPPGSVVWGGLDLSSTTDLTSWCILARSPEGVYRANWRHWIPSDRMLAAEKKDRVPYRQWVSDGYVTEIPGARIDQRVIENAIEEDARKYNLRYAGHDPWNSEGLAVRLRDAGIDMVAVQQTFSKLTAATKELEALVLAKSFDHGGNPVLEWMAENCCVSTDASGNLRPVRQQHGDGRKIDGIVAAIIALAVAMVSAAPASSVYETRGPLVV